MNAELDPNLVVQDSKVAKPLETPKKKQKKVQSIHPDYWYHQGKTDLERQYRNEWDENFSELIPGKWVEGRLIAAHDPEAGRYGGYDVASWQLDQHMHFLRKQFGEDCFAGCKICAKSEESDYQQQELWAEIGQPFPGEVPGEYPCTAFGCDQIFSYKSQLYRHLEGEHEMKIPWDSICDICGFETKQTNVEQSLRRHKIVHHGRPV
jgi:hypothetical protein